MAPIRPTLVTVIAIINIVIGGFATLGSACGAVGVAALGPIMRIAQGVAPNLPEFPAMPWPLLISAFVTYVAGFVFGILALVSGIGLLKLRPWARQLCIGASIAAIAFQLASLAATYTVLAPYNQQFQREANEWNQKYQEAIYKNARGMKPPPQMDVQAQQQLGVVAGTVVGLALCGYALFCVWAMYRPHVKAAFETADRALRSLGEHGEPREFGAG